MEQVPLRKYLEKLLEAHRSHVDTRFDLLEGRLDRLERRFPTWPQIVAVVVAIVGLALTGYAFI